MSNDSENANYDELEHSNEVTKDKKKKVRKKQTVKLILDKSLSEVISEELLRKEDLEIVNPKTVCYSIKKDQDVANFQSYLSEENDDELVLLLPATESICSPTIQSLLDYASLKGIPVLRHKE